jgi:hypothetical protein
MAVRAGVAEEDSYDKDAMLRCCTGLRNPSTEFRGGGKDGTVNFEDAGRT